MHITLSPSTLVVILIIVVFLGILLRLASRRRKYRASRTGGAPAPRKKGSGPRRGLTSRKVNHGTLIARKHGHERSPEWPAVAHEHLRHQPGCAACGYTGHGLQVHHIKPFHLHPNLELDPTNLITLCEIKGRDHHLLIGHLDDWESYNPNVRTDVNRFHKESAAKIRANPAWQKEVTQRPLA